MTSLVLNVAWFKKNSDDITGVEDLTGIGEGFTSLTHLEMWVTTIWEVNFQFWI